MKKKKSKKKELDKKSSVLEREALITVRNNLMQCAILLEKVLCERALKDGLK